MTTNINANSNALYRLKGLNIDIRGIRPNSFNQNIKNLKSNVNQIRAEKRIEVKKLTKAVNSTQEKIKQLEQQIKELKEELQDKNDSLNLQIKTIHLLEENNKTIFANATKKQKEKYIANHYYSVAETAKLSGVSPATIYRKINNADPSIFYYVLVHDGKTFINKNYCNPN